jgi:mannose/fructose/N-acetylgalactosamine-specific phosphotransferase system component IIC
LRGGSPARRYIYSCIVERAESVFSGSAAVWRDEWRVAMRFGPFLGLAILLAILWVGGFVVFHVAGFFLHLLLIFAVIALVIHFFTGGKRTT